VNVARKERGAPWLFYIFLFLVIRKRPHRMLIRNPTNYTLLGGVAVTNCLTGRIRWLSRSTYSSMTIYARSFGLGTASNTSSTRCVPVALPAATERMDAKWCGGRKIIHRENELVALSGIGQEHPACV
jgi:hypothetical protein